MMALYAVYFMFSWHIWPYRQNTYGILLQNVSTGLELFWDDFQKKIRVRPEPAPFHSNLRFLEFVFLCTAP